VAGDHHLGAVAGDPTSLHNAAIAVAHPGSEPDCSRRAIDGVMAIVGRRRGEVLHLQPVLYAVGGDDPHLLALLAGEDGRSRHDEALCGLTVAAADRLRWHRHRVFGTDGAAEAVGPQLVD